MKYLIMIIVSIILFGCNIKQHQFSPMEFDSLSKGKRIFLVGGPIGDKNQNTIYDFCYSFDQLICSMKLDKLQGKKGFIVESEPFISDRYHHGYHVILETGQKLVLKISNVYKDKDPIEAALHLVYVSQVDEARSSIGKPLIDGLSVKITESNLNGGEMEFLLSNGEKLTKSQLDQRIKFLRDYINVNNRENAFTTFKDLKLEYDEFDKKWWIKPKSYPDMAIRPYFGTNQESKWVRLLLQYKGYGWIFFDKIVVIAKGSKYNYDFTKSDIKYDNGNGKVWEWADISAKNKELNIIKALSENIGKIRFTGKYEAIRDITHSQSNEFKSLMLLYEFTKTKQNNM